MKFISFLLLIAGCYGAWHYYQLNTQLKFENQESNSQLQAHQLLIEQSAARVKNQKILAHEYEQLQQKIREQSAKIKEQAREIGELDHITELPEIEELTLGELNLETNLKKLRQIFNK